MMIEESSCSLSPVAITSSSPWRESDGYCPRSTHSPPNAPKPVSQTMADATYQDQVNRALEEMSRGSTASSLSNGLSNPERPSSHSPVMPIKRRLSPVQPLHPIERPRPRRPSNPPPIVQPHHTLCRSPPPPTPPVKPHMHSLGPSQFPPAPNMAKSHMPPASAHDLARYNDSKLAPFPALLSSSYVTSPPLAPSQITTSTNSTHNAGSVTSTPTLTSASSMSPGFSDSSLKSISPPSQPTKPSRSHGNSILSTATSFISSSLGHAHHGRASSSSSSISTSLIGQPVLIESSRTNFANCTQAGQAAHLMSPSLSQNGFNLDRFDEAEEHIEEIDPRASDTIDNRDSHSGPPYRQNSISAGIKRSSSKAASTSSPIPESSSAHPLLPQSSLMSRSSVSHSSQSSLRSSSSDHRQQILQKLGPFLNLSDFTKPNLSQRPSMLNQPPRKLRLHGPVLQVVNSTSVKDRYLFLFNDILVITKPIIEFEPNLSPEGERIPKLPITLNQSFLTKSVVELSKLECVRPRIDTKAINGNVEVKEATSLTNETKPPSSKSNVLLIQQFIGQFAIDPEQTISDAIQRGVIQEDSVSIAKVLFMTTELDKKQLGSYLSRTENVKVLKSFIDRFKFHHCRIDDALRVFMLSIRLPNDLQAVEVLLATFASQWSAVNQAIGISQSLALRLIKALFGLNDALHTSLHDSTKYVTNTFSLPHGAAHSPQHFIEFFKAENQMNQSYNSRRSIESSSEEFEPEKMISDEKLELLLNKVYVSVARDKIVQAKATDEETEPIIVTNSIAESDPEGGGAMNTFPNRLTYMIGSDQITFTIPEIDSHFGIKLFSTGLKFEPPFLTFSKSRSASFRIIGRSLGICHITFIKIGSKASKYVGLPYSKPILVERAFMKDTLQISFMNHLKTKRKYLFSFESLESRESFLEVVEYSQQQLKAQNEKLERKIGKKEEEVAELAALQVLRDTLIPNEDFMPLTVNPHTHTTISLKSSKPHSKLSNPNSQSSTNEDKSKGGLSTEEKKPSRIRSNSLSETYIHQTGSKEKDLQSIIVNKRMIAQQLHIKKKQQKLLQIHLRSNIEGGKLGLNPYSISLAKQSNGLHHHHHHHHQTNMGNGTGNLMEEKDEVELFFEKFWMKGDEVIHQCQQNSLIPLVLRFISQGVIIEKK
ncbi:hypothetical protein DFH28DRAFT_243810 [Melampsora americana]|nr:hypothetical protein DFH28DRAFT_243810 [Melampsora americana]